ncbi:mitochondrial 18 KDa protein-domain-containing protein [Annulohypoxylon maeteangense]|uniref:mitochondrial 18 KDa protein-domain-containing protein n=1 Tax=Annulohypoxylon maeteangense TaxID=1927788 RepID=UPI002007AFA5|nr:mitochondrial 18 KDa protein-domain-containing protein [Annulohypoxylon maeteangense]KAI0890285.1 mitochondrial 18 KDa protein-domain-containing protein [Annulohypoxylon maeteangense]
MWWGKGSDKSEASKDKQSEAPPATATKADPRKDATHFDPNKLPERRELPRSLQTIVDKSDRDDNFFDELVEGYAPDSTESNVRYAAYANRLRTVMLSAHRYVAYTSDIGESFRPVAHPWLVRSAYGISWAYILGDVSYEGYKAYWQNQRTLNPQLVLSAKAQKATGLSIPASLDTQPGVVSPLEDYRTVMVQRGIFQSIASMGLPAFTIHSVVKYSSKAMKGMKNKTVRVWGPIGLGLSVVPFLPTLFDKPVENAVEWMFHTGFAAYGGKEYIGDSPAIGREAALTHRPQPKTKEKEL